MDYLDGLMSEYGMTIAQARRFPFRVGLVLLRRANARNGGTDQGDSFVNAAANRARKQTREWFQRNYQII